MPTQSPDSALDHDAPRGRDSPPQRARRRRSNESDSSSGERIRASPEGERGRSRVRRPSDSFSDSNLKRRGYHTLHLPSFDRIFRVERRFKLVRELGQGAYGVVISAQDEISGEHVAIKQVSRIFTKVELAKRALREITLLRHFAYHENITGLIGQPTVALYSNMLNYSQPMEADLHQIIRSGQVLTSAHVQYFLYQVLRGVKFIHSAGVIHRDLKPGNLLVNSDCELKICDFGLARGFDDTASEENASQLTEYVATRWYRAPEIMLSFKRYTKAIDIWSLGCIFGELLLGKPLFKGKDYVDQLNKILDVLGTPDEKTMARIGSPKAQAYVRSLPLKKRRPFSKLLPAAEPEAVDLLTKLLTLDPDVRLTVVQALEHPWMSAYHEANVDDEPECPTKFDRWREQERLETFEEFRDAIWTEIQEFRKEVRGLSFISGSGSSIRRSIDYENQTMSPRSNIVRDIDGPDGPFFPPAVPESEEIATPPPPSDDEGDDEDEEDDGPLVTTSRHETNSEQPAAFDPMQAYSDARRASTLPESVPEASSIAFPRVASEDNFIYPARSRTTSMITGGRLLRTLSTISIQEVAEDATQLAAKAPVGRYIVEMSAADAPISELPKDFEG
ncbi:kinase-like protein [Sistotremastrum niveocremeum HHB9708]|uniref:Mitogen-activated protein kinase n=1 Tax=Sistotremastrum niveocremeum HHB9708 TaxID=1314777 RepID=A0A164VYX2_9AGAM|nr:kinase-like protein [Sistotremastrum niveocremeum HHB9708]